MSRRPLLGSEYLESIQTPTGVDNLEAATCFNFSRFQQLLKQFRALDDQVLLRINRQHALNRSRDPGNYSAFDNRECAALWSDLVGNWRGREKIVRFCADQADSQASASAEGDESFARRVLTQQIRNELAVETIVRRRTMNEFLRRCSSFTPPKGSVPPEDLAHLPAPTRERLV